MSCSSAIQNVNNWLPSFPGFKSCDKPAEKAHNKTTLFGYDVKQLSDNLDALTTTTAMTECFHSTVKFMACLAGAVSPALILDKLAITMIQVDQFIDSARLISDVKKLISLKYVDDILAGRYLSAASDVSFLISDFGSSMSFLGYLRLIDIEKIGAAVGSIGIYGHYVPSIAVDVFVGTLSLHVQTIAFMFLGLQTACDIASEGITKERILWLVTCIFEVVHKTFLFLAGSALLTPTGVVTAGVLGMIANGFGIWSAYEDVMIESKPPKSALVPLKV